MGGHVKTTASKWILGFITTLLVLFLFLPLIIVVAFSFNGGFDAFQWGGFSAAAYGQATQDSTLITSMRISVEVAVATGLLSMAVGLIGGLASTGRRWTHRLLFILFVVILATPEIVGASGDLLWFVTLGVSNGFTRLIIAHSIFGSALTALIVRGRALGLEPGRLRGGQRPRRANHHDVAHDRRASVGSGVDRGRAALLHLQPRGPRHVDLRQHRPDDAPARLHPRLAALPVPHRHLRRRGPLFVSTTVLFIVALAVMGGGSRSRMRRGLRLLAAAPAPAETGA